MRREIVCLFSLLLLLLSVEASMGNYIYDFCIFNNSDLENDLRLNFTVTLSEEGFDSSGNVLAGFEFKNNSSVVSSITSIYFDDRGISLLYIDEPIASEEGVSFSTGAKPNHLPAGDELVPKFSKPAQFSTDSDPSAFYNGIGPGEQLKLIFALNADRSLADIIAELGNGESGTEQNLRIGLHIQGIEPSGESVSAINYPQPIPEPITIALLTAGLFTIYVKSKHKKN